MLYHKHFKIRVKADTQKGHIQNHFEELHLFHTLLLLEEAGDDITRFTIEIRNYKDASKLKEALSAVLNIVREEIKK